MSPRNPDADHCVMLLERGHFNDEVRRGIEANWPKALGRWDSDPSYKYMLAVNAIGDERKPLTALCRDLVELVASVRKIQPRLVGRIMWVPFASNEAVEAVKVEAASYSEARLREMRPKGTA